MGSYSRLNFFSLFVVNLLVGFNSGAQKLPQNKFQEQLTPNRFVAIDDLIKKYELIRLWTLNDPKSFSNPRLLIRDAVNGDFMDEQVTVLDYAQSSGLPILSKKRSPLMSRFPISEHSGVEDFYAILPRTCSITGGETFAEFKSSYFTSDETDVAAHLVLINATSPKTSDPLHSAALMEELRKVENQKHVVNTTSLIRTLKYPGTNQERIIPSDYTIGGWFKPMWNNGTNQMTLLTKSFSNPTANGMVENEWWIFATGNMIYFHPLYDTSVATTQMYMDPVDARRFRMDNFIYYRDGESYDDAVRRNNPLPYTNSSQGSGAIPLILKPFKTKKPIPPPDVVPPPLDPKPPVVVPFPPLPQPPIVIPPGGAHKAHIFDFDLKQFWWSTSLGICYQCERQNEHRDVWHYIAISARLNDPLGPYIDFYVIQDPQESIFGQRPTWEANFRHRRIELPREQVSRPHVNPILHSTRVNKNCDINSKRCVRSQLKIGSDAPNDKFKGFMRGVYMSKSALSESGIIEMARQFRPMDSCRLTYDQK